LTVTISNNPRSMTTDADSNKRDEIASQRIKGVQKIEGLVHF